MKDGKVSRAMEHLDDELIASSVTKADLSGHESSLLERRNRMKRNIWKPMVAVAAGLVVALAVGFGSWQMTMNRSDAVIALDVNPSIEIEINRKEEIKEVRALNEDARTVLGDMDLEDVDLEVGVNAIIGSMLKKGYLSTDKNSILISIDSKNQEKATALKERLSKEINTLLGGQKISASVITQNFEKNEETNQQATQNNISPAKATLISKIVATSLLDANGVPYTYETLAELNVNELKLILESRNTEVEGIQSAGNASTTQYKTREEALEIALTKANVAQNEIIYPKVELDYDDDIRAMVYDVEFHYNNLKYEYEINAQTGEILQQEIEPCDDKHYQLPTPPVTTPVVPEETPAETEISREKALEIAHKDAGVSKDQVHRPEIEVDYEKGNKVYEIEFKASGLEYEYTLNATTGAILEKESEPID